VLRSSKNIGEGQMTFYHAFVDFEKAEDILPRELVVPTPKWDAG